MRYLEVFGDTMDRQRILGTMCFPEDAALRTAYVVDAIAREQSRGESTQEVSGVTREILAVLVSLPTVLPTMPKEIRAGVRAGLLAGEFYAALYAMHCFPSAFPEPSKKKALFYLQDFAQRRTFGDGSGIVGSQPQLLANVKAAESVAHLWAALRLHKEYPMRPHAQVFSSPDAIASFLGIAASLEHFLTTFVPKRAKPRLPLVDSNKLWRVPQNTLRLRPPWVDVPASLQSVLGNYQAPRTRNY